jgi:hypothetical protein
LIHGFSGFWAQFGTPLRLIAREVLKVFSIKDFRPQKARQNL